MEYENPVLLELRRLSRSGEVDTLSVLERVLNRVMDAQADLTPDIRPYDSRGRGGGLLMLDTAVPLLVLPDLHARRDFLMAVLEKKLARGISVFEALCRQELQILCLGDGFHSEKRGLFRWREGLAEYKKEYRRHKAMDLEMAESLGLMEMIMILQSVFPGQFFFLKGNHENILNEEGEGNHPFGKYVYEGEMVKAWVIKFLGESFLYSYAEYEKNLPYMAAAESLLFSHAEPAACYSPGEIVDIYRYDDIKLGLTWTGNGQAEQDAVEGILSLWSSVGRGRRARRVGKFGPPPLRAVCSLPLLAGHIPFSTSPGDSSFKPTTDVPEGKAAPASRPLHVILAAPAVFRLPHGTPATPPAPSPVWLLQMWPMIRSR